MDTNKRTGRIVALLFILMIVSGSVSLNLRGLSGSLAESENFLQHVFENATDMKVSVLLSLVAGTFWIGIAALVFPAIRQRKNSLVMWYFALGFLILQFAISSFGDISRLSLISLSEESVKEGGSEADHFKILGILYWKEYLWAHFLALIGFAIGAGAFYFSLYQARLIPLILSAWGIVAVTIVLNETS